MTAGYFTPDQVTQLLAGINPSRVSRKDNQSHLEAYDVRAHLNRILGFGRWDGEVVADELVFEEIDGEKVWNPEKKGYNGQVKPGWDDNRRISVGYRVRYRLVVKAPDGTELAAYTEVAAGDATNFPGSKRADAHDFAVKTAESQALKRCAINLGDQFGLSLYHKGSTNALVLRTLVGMPAQQAQAPSGQVDAGTPDVVPEQQPDHLPEQDAFDDVHTGQRERVAEKAAAVASEGDESPAALAASQGAFLQAAASAGLSKVQAMRVLHQKTGKALAEASIAELRTATEHVRKNQGDAA